jgi:hypothetical protein
MIFSILVALLAFGLRFFWITDMEYKRDEAATVRFVESLAHAPWTPLAPVSDHSGLAHSSGFFYLLHWLSLGSSDPLVLVSVIAGLNALAIALVLWFSRGSMKGRLFALMCASSFTLVLASRKIWTPTLMPAWAVLCIGLVLYAENRRIDSPTRSRLALVVGGLAILLTGHMYLPGFSLAAGVAPAIALFYLVQRRWADFRAWVSGCFLGLATWLPYLQKILTHAPEAFSSDPLILHSARDPFRVIWLWNSIKVSLQLAAPIEMARLYIFRAYGEVKAVSPAWLLLSLSILILALSLLWVGVYLASLTRIWKRRSAATADPLVWASFAGVVSTIIGLQVVKLGNMPFYWFGVVPFAYYLIAWACADGGMQGFGKRMRFLVYLGSVGSAVAVLLFFVLVHVTGRFMPEYRDTYRMQIEQNRVGTLN